MPSNEQQKLDNEKNIDSNVDEGMLITNKKEQIDFNGKLNSFKGK